MKTNNILDGFRLDGKVAIVTGASTGLGQAMALALAEAGADIIGIEHINASETKAIIEELGQKYYQLTCDLINATPSDLVKLIDDTKKLTGHIDILVNNAGIIRRNDSLVFNEKDWDDVMNINIKNLFFLSQAVANVFVSQGHGGKIISIASMLSYQGGIRVPSYTAAKSAVKGITMTMANEWAKYGININAIAPGYMATNNTLALREDETRAGQILERIPAGRWGTARDVAGACVFLAGDNATYINGFTLAVDGGWLAR